MRKNYNFALSTNNIIIISISNNDQRLHPTIDPTVFHLDDFMTNYPMRVVLCKNQNVYPDVVLKRQSLDQLFWDITNVDMNK